MYTPLSILLVLICQIVTATKFHPLSDDFIDHINKRGKWRAGRNFHRDTPISYIRHLMGAKLEHPGLKNLPSVQHDPELIKNLPDSFDSRKKWPNCSSLYEIRDQASCGSCWAFGAVEAMTDRVCIYSNGTKNFHFSAEDLVTCGAIAGDCDGGLLSQAWKIWVDEGLVSGGNYNSSDGCRPYTLAPCDHEHKTDNGGLPPCHNGGDTPPCKRKCIDGYNVPYDQDKRHGKRIYAVKGENNIKAELFLNGPLEVAFMGYEDFIHYKGGVYQHLSGEFLGGHAVKIMGWGEEDGKKYWLIANSWNTSWGAEGFFKILRGVNECDIENTGVAGEPALEDY